MKSDQPEHRLSHHVDMLLDRIIVEPAWFTAIDNAQPLAKKDANGREPVQSRMNWEQKRRARGIKPAHLDWMLFQDGRYAQFELKIKGNVPSANQNTTIRLLTERNIPAAVCWSVWDVYEFLVRSGFRLHANAENIAVEITERWRAAQDGAEMKKPARKAKPRAGKPTQRALNAAARANDLWR